MFFEALRGPLVNLGGGPWTDQLMACLIAAGLLYAIFSPIFAPRSVGCWVMSIMGMAIWFALGYVWAQIASC